MTIEEWNKWLLREKGINVQVYYNQFLRDHNKNVKTKQEILEFVCQVTNLSMIILTTNKGKFSRGGSNHVARSRGYLVKAILEAYPGLFSLKKIYLKVFGFNKDHSTAIHHRDTELFGEELEMYNKILNYIKTYDIQWVP